MNQKIINLEDILSDHFYDTFNVWKKHNIDFAPRASTKTSKNSIKIALKMKEHKDMEVVIIRENYVDHRKSTFKEMITAFKRLGINLKQGTNYPKGTTGPLWIKTPWNSLIHFAHMHDLESLKGVVPSSDDKFIGIAYFFEINQFKSQEFGLNHAVSSFSRGIKPFYHNIYEWNPAPNKSDWTYEFLEKMKKRPDSIIIEGTYLDVPKTKRELWFGELIHEIDILKEIDYEQYAHIYLGKLYKAEGSIYKKFDVNKHVFDLHKEFNPGIKYYIGVDYGTSDGTAFEFGVINRGYKGLRILKEYYHKNGLTPGEKVVNDYAADLLQFVIECYTISQAPITVIIDEAAGDFYDIFNSLAMLRIPNMCIVETTHKNNANRIHRRISVENLMVGSEFIRIDQSCKYLIKAIDLAEYDNKGERLDNTSTHFNDALDAFEYVWIHLIDDIQNLILTGVKYQE
jgi:PBSX family phage terminase large subunit